MTGLCSGIDPVLIEDNFELFCSSVNRLMRVDDNDFVPIKRCEYTLLKLCTIFLSLWFSSFAWGQKGEFLSAADFRDRVFSHQPAKLETLWLTGSMRKKIEQVLNHSFKSLRIRYWRSGQRTAWVLEEIGKELPITIGIAIEDQKIKDLAILTYRESRGGEVRHPFFTRQFYGLKLAEEDSFTLNNGVDGITGATLSVRAVKKTAIVALLLHDQALQVMSLNHKGS